MKAYPKEKAEALIKKLHDRGLWYYDPDFEGDEEDWLPGFKVKYCFKFHLGAQQIQSGFSIGFHPSGDLLLHQLRKRNQGRKLYNRVRGSQSKGQEQPRACGDFDR